MNKIKIVLDTNVLLVSISSKSNYHWIFQELVSGSFVLVITTEILLEYEEIVKRRFNATVAENVIRALLQLPNVIHQHVYFNWTLSNPWMLLLAMVVYDAQDTWAAEGSGGLLLELPAGQNAFQPGEISVLAQTADGGEIRCGTLAELVLRTLNHLGMDIFPHRPDVQGLNAMISPMIGQLLEHHVWGFRDGVSGEEGQYRIHPKFADVCYRISSSRVFNRTGKHLWHTVRLESENWKNEISLKY